MEIYIDTANLNEIEEAQSLSILDGVTTNPSILSKQSLPHKEVLAKINSIVNGKVWYQVVSDTSDEMVKEALQIIEILDKPVIKLPMGGEALKATRVLTNQGIETNMTLVYSVSQAILAANAGAAYVSPYVGRINDIGLSGLNLIQDIVNVFQVQNISTKVIGASLRGSHDIVDVASLGAKAVTMPYRVLMQMIEHPMTDKGRLQFSEDWNTYQTLVTSNLE
ncbi:transaldolase family protein [Bacillus sp. AFS040349]|uniref:transaldolase family protein n=1 Tax=Bacillus sp. AFS040349 TaxID=2033502 RepID=UPI000BFD744E|nr:transaldolase family protein [Bacillus sp. AFS040349]PGT83774.1 fructose-6-phosphate aldolase [Bacillus sp. AFS040349]